MRGTLQGVAGQWLQDPSPHPPQPQPGWHTKLFYFQVSCEVQSEAAWTLLLPTLPWPALPHGPSRSRSSRSSQPLPRPRCRVPALCRASADSALCPPSPAPRVDRSLGVGVGTTGSTLEPTSLSLPLQGAFFHLDIPQGFSNPQEEV